ncbi:MAG: hypothetical protein CMB97_00085 [Flavobacteriaceae bacterium]|nr:hypothetical protein [Flavobacteriaceae bacterium]
MNIIFVYSLDDIQSSTNLLQTQQQMQFGISYISSLLKQHGHHTKLLVISRILQNKNREILDEYINDFQPQVICFTAVATEYPFIAGIAKHIRKTYKDIFLLIGGSHASLKPDEVQFGDFDALCIGEGEHPTLELISQLKQGLYPRGIPNLWIRQGSKFEKNLPRPFIQNLDDLPFPDRAMWGKWTEDKLGKVTSVLIGRGCPFNCTYCCNHALKKLTSGTYVRFRSPDNIIKEIRDIISQFPDVEEIFLEVETIAINIDWATELCSELKDLNATLAQPLSFGTNVRITPNARLEELFESFRESNFRFVNIGLESGSERVRREILKRNYSNEDVINAVVLARKYGLQVAFFNIIGIPGETIDDFNETVTINRVCQPDWHMTSIFFPYSGTDLYDLCEKQGLLKKPLEVKMERKKSHWTFPNFLKNKFIKHIYGLTTMLIRALNQCTKY